MKSGIRFVIVGGSATFLDFIIYIIISMKFPIYISKGISMSISCLFSFFLNRKWTFKVTGKYNWLEVFKYILVQMINITINICSNSIVYKITKEKVLAFLCATFAAMCVNYCLQRFIVFKSNDSN